MAMFCRNVEWGLLDLIECIQNMLFRIFSVNVPLRVRVQTLLKFFNATISSLCNILKKLFSPNLIIERVYWLISLEIVDTCCHATHLLWRVSFYLSDYIIRIVNGFYLSFLQSVDSFEHINVLDPPFLSCQLERGLSLLRIVVTIHRWVSRLLVFVCTRCFLNWI